MNDVRRKRRSWLWWLVPAGACLLASPVLGGSGLFGACAFALVAVADLVEQLREERLPRGLESVWRSEWAATRAVRVTGPTASRWVLFVAAVGAGCFAFLLDPWGLVVAVSVGLYELTKNLRVLWGRPRVLTVTPQGLSIFDAGVVSLEHVTDVTARRGVLVVWLTDQGWKQLRNSAQGSFRWWLRAHRQLAGRLYLPLPEVRTDEFAHWLRGVVAERETV